MHDGIGPGSRRIGAQNTVELLLPLIAAARAEGLSVGPLSQGSGVEGAQALGLPSERRRAMTVGGQA